MDYFWHGFYKMIYLQNKSKSQNDFKSQYISIKVNVLFKFKLYLILEFVVNFGTVAVNCPKRLRNSLFLPKFWNKNKFKKKLEKLQKFLIFISFSFCNYKFWKLFPKSPHKSIYNTFLHILGYTLLIKNQTKLKKCIFFQKLSNIFERMLIHFLVFIYFLKIINKSFVELNLSTSHLDFS